MGRPKGPEMARINVRLEQDLYDDYAAAARVLNLSVPELVRDLLGVAREWAQGIVVMAERAESGDTAAAVALMQQLLAARDDRLELAALVSSADTAGLAAVLDRGVAAGLPAGDLAAAVVEQAARPRGGFADDSVREGASGRRRRTA